MSPGASRLLLRYGTPALLAVITWADYATGYELGFFVFYFAPVALAAWYGSRAMGVGYAVAAGACWYLSDRLSLHPYSTAWLVYWETIMRLVSFATTALTLSQIRSDLERREQLLDVISHDLRAPLGALTGHAQLLGRRAGDAAFAAARAGDILRCAARMDAMIEDLLDVARQDSRQLRPAAQVVPVEACLSEVLARCAPVLDPARVRLAVDGEGVAVRADPAHLDRIVTNLLLNALKYAPPESPVVLGASGGGGRVIIRVADRGPGIAPEDLPHLFDRFYRSRRHAGREGLGLGLYSVRLLAEANGGSVRAEPAEGGGAAFVVVLPEAERAAAGT